MGLTEKRKRNFEGGIDSFVDFFLEIIFKKIFKNLEHKQNLNDKILE